MERTLSHAGQKEGNAPVNDWLDDQWWRQFGSPDLDRIMEIALRDNPGLKKAYARLGAAGAVAQVEGAAMPGVCRYFRSWMKSRLTADMVIRLRMARLPFD